MGMQKQKKCFSHTHVLHTQDTKYITSLLKGGGQLDQEINLTKILQGSYLFFFFETVTRGFETSTFLPK